MKYCIIIALLFSRTAIAQTDLPVRLLIAPDTTKPVIFYISGDGGWNDFSTSLVAAVHAKGYTVASLNAKSYFWEKRTPEEAAAAIGNYITSVIRPKAAQPIVLVGYSFGADVVPFIVKKMPADVSGKCRAVVLLSPSSSTDFEIHISELLGWGKKRKMDVVAAVNELTDIRISAVFGDDEKEFPITEIHNHHFLYRHLPGGHHYESNMNMVAAAVIAGF